MKFDFSKVPAFSKCTACWAQCMEDGIRSEVWIGTEDGSWLVGARKDQLETWQMLAELQGVLEAIRLLRDTT